MVPLKLARDCPKSLTRVTQVPRIHCKLLSRTRFTASGAPVNFILGPDAAGGQTQGYTFHYRHTGLYIIGAA